MIDETVDKPDKMKLLLEIHGLMSMHKITQTQIAKRIPASIVSVHNWLKTSNLTTYDNLYKMLEVTRELIDLKQEESHE